MGQLELHLGPARANSFGQDQRQTQSLQSRVPFGRNLIEFFSGHLFHRGSEGRFNSESYQEFPRQVLQATPEHLFLIQEGARYHTSAATRAFFAAHQERMTVFQLPSYSPDYNPIEYLWRRS